jgi:hypothetical protein
MMAVMGPMFVLANANTPLGEITVSGLPQPGQPAVLVNGEPASTGRSLFSSSTVSTPESMGATVNLANGSRLVLAPNSSLTLSAGDTIGTLSTGSLTLSSAAEAVSVLIADGSLVTLGVGETALATSARAARDHRDKTTGKCIDDDNDGKEECTEGLPVWAWGAIVAGIAGAVIIAVVASNDDEGTAASPVR